MQDRQFFFRFFFSDSCFTEIFFQGFLLLFMSLRFLLSAFEILPDRLHPFFVVLMVLLCRPDLFFQQFHAVFQLLLFQSILPCLGPRFLNLCIQFFQLFFQSFVFCLRLVKLCLCLL